MVLSPGIVDFHAFAVTPAKIYVWEFINYDFASNLT